MYHSTEGLKEGGREREGKIIHAQSGQLQSQVQCVIVSAVDLEDGVVVDGGEIEREVDAVQPGV